MNEPHDDPRDVWERYVASWKAATAQEKEALFETCLSPRCVYTDPLRRTNGWKELLAYMLEFHAQVPGGHFVTERFFTHHGKSVARWTMRDAASRPIGDGISYAEYDEGGKLVGMTGFFEVPAT